MIETYNYDPETDELLYRVQPSRTFFINTEANSLGGVIDGLEAVKQAVMVQLDSLRFAYEIMPADFGSEMDLLIGQQYRFILAELPRVVREACFRDDRVNSVTVYNIVKQSIDSLSFNVSVSSVVGDFELEGVDVTIGR